MIQDIQKWIKETDPKSIVATIRYDVDLDFKIRNLFNENSKYFSKISPYIYLIKNNLNFIDIVCKNPNCNKYRKFLKINSGFQNTCGDSVCVKVSRTEVNKESYKKVDKQKAKEKQQQTNLRKYGVKHNWNSGSISREKMKQTLIEKYGTDNVNKVDFIAKKMKETKLKKYGSLNNFTKIEETNLKKYGVKYPLQNKIIHRKTTKQQSKTKLEILQTKLKKFNQTLIINSNSNYTSLKCNKCGDINHHIFRSFISSKLRNGINPCKTCNPNYPKYRSKQEDEVYQYVKEIYLGKIETNVRYVLKNLELDIFLPELKLAIEYNGDYWHSSIFKEDNYHEIKSERCLQQGVKLLHVWEKDWVNNKIQTQNIILEFLKINTF